MFKKNMESVEGEGVLGRFLGCFTEFGNTGVQQLPTNPGLCIGLITVTRLWMLDRNRHLASRSPVLKTSRLSFRRYDLVVFLDIQPTMPLAFPSRTS